MSGSHFRWESELSLSFQEHAKPALWARSSKGTWVRAQESTCSEGRADIVWGRFDCRSSVLRLRRHASLLQNPTASRLLANLHKGPAQSEEELRQSLGVTTPVLRKCLSALRAARFVAISSRGRFMVIPKKVVVPAEICSFELKLKDWRRALYQATRYRSFSHRVYVVMPTHGASIAYEHHELFRKANIGLVAHGDCGDSSVLIHPKKCFPQAKYRAIMAAGMLSECRR